MGAIVGILISWAVLSVAVWIAATVLDGVEVRDVPSVVLVAALFGVLNFLLGGIFFWVIGLATLGIGLLLAFLTRWLVDAIILKIVDGLTDRISVDGFGTAFLAALIMALVGTVGQWLVELAGLGVG